mmetsp:Transcript_61244/g.134109  ORF Transcript_61244/g.134109 Transcript_61244/m.134109 type:complete len:231 (+) Transcript_61244:628-1320(+)
MPVRSSKRNSRRSSSRRRQLWICWPESKSRKAPQSSDCRWPKWRWIGPWQLKNNIASRSSSSNRNIGKTSRCSCEDSMSPLKLRSKTPSRKKRRQTSDWPQSGSELRQSLRKPNCPEGCFTRSGRIRNASILWSTPWEWPWFRSRGRRTLPRSNASNGIAGPTKRNDLRSFLRGKTSEPGGRVKWPRDSARKSRKETTRAPMKRLQINGRRRFGVRAERQPKLRKPRSRC